MHWLSDQEFQIGLTMSGAISAGAYTTGVIEADEAILPPTLDRGRPPDEEPCHNDSACR